MRDQSFCGLHNLRRTAVIYRKRNDLRFRIIVRKMQHNLRLCAPETVDGLIVVPHDKEMILRRRDLPYKTILQRRDILKFINQQIAVSALIAL